jgi:hypothetical protein
MADLTTRQRHSKGKTAQCPLDGKLGKTQSKSRRCEEQRFEVLSVMTIYIYTHTHTHTYNIHIGAGIAQSV